MSQGLVLGLKPKPEFLPLFNLGEPVTTGDSVGTSPTRLLLELRNIYRQILT